jgi:hypothetical protein
MRSRPIDIALGLLLLSVIACAPIDVTEFALQPSQNINLEICASNLPELSADIATVSSRQNNTGGGKSLSIEDAVSSFERVKSNIPWSLRQTTVIRIIFQSGEYVIAQTVNSKHRLLETKTLLNGAGSLDEYESKFISGLEPKDTINNKDLRQFVDEFAEQILRHTSSSPQTAIDSAKVSNDQFWTILVDYYTAYAKGNFVDYFGNKYDKPTISSTVTDAELGNSVSVILEMIFDAAAKTPVWQPTDNSQTGTTTAKSTKITNLPNDVTKLGWQKGMSISDTAKEIPDGTTISSIDPGGKALTLSSAATASDTKAALVVTNATYYPAATTNKPTGLTLGILPLQLMSLSESAFGCGMTQKKAETIMFLSQAFSSAASNVVGGAVGTIGGFGWSLGVFGKISIGDNKAITALVQTLAAELVKRLTVEATYPILDSVSATSTTTKYQMTQLFISPNYGVTPTHNSLLP